MREVEAPGEQLHERVLHRLRRRRGLEVADQRDADGAGVEPVRVRTDHVPRDPAGASLEDVAEAIDEKVVTDVVPAVSLHVVVLDAAHDRRRLGACVVFEFAVWWTTASFSFAAYIGLPRTISSSAFQPARVTIAGSPAEASVRGGADVTRLHSSYACRFAHGPRRAAPRNATDAPVQVGSSSAGCQPDQRPRAGRGRET